MLAEFGLTAFFGALRVKAMNEFDALSLIIDTAIKHARHNQKLHGRRGGASYEQTSMIFDAPEPPPAGASNADDEFAKAYKAKVSASHQRTIDLLKKETSELSVKVNQRIKLENDLSVVRRELEGALAALTTELNVTRGPKQKMKVEDKHRSRISDLRDKLDRLVARRKGLPGVGEGQGIIKQKTELIQRLESEIASMPDRPSGWPSVAVARDAANLRATFSAMTQEVTRLADESKKILNGPEMSGYRERKTELQVNLSKAKTAAEKATVNKQIAAVDEKIANLEKRAAEVLGQSYDVQKQLASKGYGRAELLDSLNGKITTGKVNPAYNPNVSADMRRILKEEFDHAQQFFDGRLQRDSLKVMTDPSGATRSAYVEPNKTIYLGTGVRSTDDQRSIDSASRRTIAHELAHSWDAIPGVREQSIAFLERRTAGSPDALYARSSFGKEEIYREGGFFHRYVGIIYRSDDGNFHGTEVLSMGFQRMRYDPAEFARQDPDHFDFVYSIMRGDW